MEKKIDIYKNTGIKQRVIDEIRELAEKHGVERVLLFGSRARGDHKERSDIDLAFQGGNRVEFALDVEENTYTLLKFDCVDLDGAVSPELMASINSEGILIYEKTG